jgi:hypothetical protein
MPPKVFHEFGNYKPRETWPVEMDLAGVERNTTIRKAIKPQLEESMSRSLSTNSFVGEKSIDLNKPPHVAYNPYDPKNEYPKMLYHQTKKDHNWMAEHRRIMQHNSLHPEKPEILPTVPPANIVVKSRQEEEMKLTQGYQLKPPPVQEEAAEETLCSRGCGSVPHRGACKVN